MRLSIFTLLFALHLSCLENICYAEPRWLLVRDIPSPDVFVPNFGLRIAMHSGMGVASGFHFEEINDGSVYTQYGVVYTFSLEGDAPPQELHPIGTPPIYNDFVITAISENRVLVGDDEDFYGTTGAAYLFDRTTGQQIARLTAPDGQVGRDAWFGYNVALTTDYAVVTTGAFRENGAYIFNARDGQFIRKIAESGTSEIWSIDTHEDLALIARSERGDDENVYLYNLDTGDILQSFGNPNPSEDDTFGWYIALNENYAAVSSRHRGSGMTSGTVSVFDISTGNLVFQFDGNGNPYNTLEISGNLLIIGAYFSPSTPTRILNLNTFQFLPDLPHAETVAIDGKFVLLGRGDRVQVYRLVPEPATHVLLLLSLTSAAFWRRSLASRH